MAAALELLEATEDDLKLLDDEKFYTEIHRKFYSDDIKSIKEEFLGKKLYNYSMFKGLKIKVHTATVGFLWYAFRTDVELPTKKTWYAGILIGQQFQRKHYGKQALTKLLKDFIPNNTTFIMYTMPDNIPCQKLLESLGLENHYTTDTLMYYYKKTEICL
jgi:RimJ/RimL family protein N-acetyltransferase